MDHDMTDEEISQAAELMVKLRKASGYRFPGEGTGEPLQLTEADLADALAAIESAWPVLRDAAEVVDECWPTL